MIEVNVHEAETNLSRLLRRVAVGRRRLGEDEGRGW